MRASLFALMLVTTGCSRPASRQTIECPTPESGKLAGTVRESAAQIAAVGHQLHYGDKGAIGEVTAAVRRRHPDADRGAMINYLITAYCPDLNSDGALDLRGRRRAMESFAKQAEAAVGSGTNSDASTPQAQR